MTNHDREVELLKADETVWITVNNILVRVMMTDEGALCDMYSQALIKDDHDEAHLAACYAFFNEAGAEASDDADEDMDYFNDD